MSGLGCDRTHGRSGSAQIETNEESGYLPYVLGRMFSIYEQIQLAAIPGINTTIKDKYFTSASTTPARIFPILGDLAAKHMRKTWKSEGLKVKLDKALGELTGRVGDRYPSRLSLEERGAFQLGYYFENQKRFDKANKNNNEQGENNDSTAFIGTDFEFLLQRCISCANGPMCADRNGIVFLYAERQIPLFDSR